MKNNIYISDLLFEIDCTDEFTYKKCTDYITDRIDELPDMKIKVKEEEVIDDGQGFSFGYRENIAIYEKIAEQLPHYDRCVFHGAVITFNGDGYMFTAASGTGKSTHIKLWKRFLQEKVDIVNGDKPILKVTDNEVTAYGTPWCGKENWNKNCSTVLRGICVLKQGKSNAIQRLTPQDAIVHLYKQIYLPEGGQEAALTLEMLDKILRNVPIYSMRCDISEDAVRTSFEAMTGLQYEDYKRAGDLCDEN